MDVDRLVVGLGRAAPHHRQPLAVVLLAERLDVLDELLDLLPLREPVGADIVRSFETRDPVVGEDGRHGRDRSHLLADALDVLGAEDTGSHRRRIGVVGIRVPASEDDVVEIGERHELPDQRIAVVGPLTEPDVTHLGQRADRGRLTGAGRQDSGVQRGGDGPHSGGEDSQPAGGRCDGGLRHESSKFENGSGDGTGGPPSEVRSAICALRFDPTRMSHIARRASQVRIIRSLST